MSFVRLLFLPLRGDRGESAGGAALPVGKGMRRGKWPLPRLGVHGFCWFSGDGG